MKNWMRHIQQIPTILQAVLNITLGLVAFTLCFFLLKETWYIFSFIFISGDPGTTAYEFMDKLLVFFLYFEFIALIVKYFKSGFHFPLRYFIYIGITAIIRLIIVDYEDAMNTLLWSLAILALLGALLLANSRPIRRDN
ncbi:phosphate-starvation-inducible protein PsiE [Paenibacillus wulumuqiensis]|uniref:phosphate-starvation-inducible protein PsiE n=1 Tax=Paenibacillus wulumuqiensis TaxID=1567107 RepID=UPI0006192CAD|nr:phosphate-starvation-inducible protein PsiE [Paenibacillus wulumuqiensis]